MSQSLPNGESLTKLYSKHFNTKKSNDKRGGNKKKISYWQQRKGFSDLEKEVVDRYD